jgi:hypothetical protein
VIPSPPCPESPQFLASACMGPTPNDPISPTRGRESAQSVNTKSPYCPGITAVDDESTGPLCQLFLNAILVCLARRRAAASTERAENRLSRMGPPLGVARRTCTLPCKDGNHLKVHLSPRFGLAEEAERPGICSQGIPTTSVDAQ